MLDTAQVPDGEGAPGRTTQGGKESSDNHRKVNVCKIVKDKTHNSEGWAALTGDSQQGKNKQILQIMSTVWSVSFREIQLQPNTVEVNKILFVELSW